MKGRRSWSMNAAGAGTVLLAFVPLEVVSELQTAHAAQAEVIGDNGRVALVAMRPSTTSPDRSIILLTKARGSE